MDRAIEKVKADAIYQDKLHDERMNLLQASIKMEEVERSKNKSRAEVLREIGVEEIKSEALDSLGHIEEMETKEEINYRKKMYFGTAGEQQSLLYRQVWEPFTDPQHEAVLQVLTGWHHDRGQQEDHYIWNVTLPEILLHIYMKIFRLSTIAEAEECVSNTPLCES